MRKLLVFGLFVLILSVLVGSFPQTSYSFNSDLDSGKIETMSYQNATIKFPSWESGQFYNTYSQFGELHLLPFETEGGWQTEIYSINTIYVYNIITMCYNDADLTITFYCNYDGTGWNNLPLTGNYTLNSFLNGNWEFFFIFNFTTLIAYPIIFNFTIYYIDDITFPIAPPYVFTNSILNICLLFSLLLFLCLIYLKIRSITLISIAYLIFLPITIQSLWDLTIPFYPFVQLFSLTVGTFLFLDLIITYKKQTED